MSYFGESGLKMSCPELGNTPNIFVPRHTSAMHWKVYPTSHSVLHFLEKDNPQNKHK